MCADQLWNLRVFWLGIPIVVLHELFVKLVQNLPKKMGDINFFLNWKKQKPLKICEKKPGWSVPKDSLRGQWNKKVQHRKNPKDLKSQQNAIIMGQRSHQIEMTLQPKCLCWQKRLQWARNFPSIHTKVSKTINLAQKTIFGILMKKKYYSKKLPENCKNLLIFWLNLPISSAKASLFS